jgi:hypothetical protein
VDQPIEDRIGERGVSDSLMPVFERQLAGEDGGASVVTVFQHLQEISAVFLTERGQGSIIQDKDIGFGQRAHQCHLAPIDFGDREFLQQAGEAQIEGRQVMPAGLMAQGTRQPGFPDARWPGDEHIVTVADPLARGQTGDDRFV